MKYHISNFKINKFIYVHIYKCYQAKRNNTTYSPDAHEVCVSKRSTSHSHTCNIVSIYFILPAFQRKKVATLLTP